MGCHAVVLVGEDVTETLEVIPKSWEVIQHVREKLPAVTARGVARRG